MLFEGNAIVEIDGARYAIEAQDTTYIPANLPHRFINALDAEPLNILWIYANVDATRTIVASGDRRIIEGRGTTPSSSSTVAAKANGPPRRTSRP